MPIEVREDESVSTLLEHSAEKGEHYLFGLLGFLSWIFFVLAGVLVVVFVVMYVMAWNSMRAGSSMAHKPQVDDN